MLTSSYEENMTTKKFISAVFNLLFPIKHPLFFAF